MKSSFAEKNDAWNRVSRYFRATVAAASVVASISHLAATFLQEDFASYTFEQLRVRIFCVLMYCSWIPFLTLSIQSILRKGGWNPPNHPVGQRIIFTILGFLVGATLALLPFLLIEFGSSASGRAGLMYGLVATYFIGLVFFGAVMTYGAALGVWMAFFGSLALWKPNQ